MAGHLGAADLAAQAGDFDTAIAELEGAEQIDPENPEVLYALGTTHARAGRYEEALAYLSKLAEVSGDDPNRYKAHSQMALVYLRLQDLPAARQQFERVVELDPTNVTAVYFLVRLSYDAGDDAASLQYIEAFRRIVAAQDVTLLSEEERADLDRALEGLSQLEAIIRSEEETPQ